MAYGERRAKRPAVSVPGRPGGRYYEGDVLVLKGREYPDAAMPTQLGNLPAWIRS